jgi:hypothetical protein
LTPDDENRSEMPSQPTTVQLPAVPPWAIELTKSVKTGIAELRADVALVSNDLGIVKDRVTILESRRNDDDARAARISGGVRNLSTTDAEQSAQLAQERAAREALATKVDELATTNVTQLAILTRLDKVASNPTVKLLMFAIGTIVTGWLAGKGLALK